MDRKRILTALLAVLAVGGIGLVAAQSVALPQEKTFSVDNQTEALRVSAENISANSDGFNALDVEVFGVDSGGNETSVDTGEVNTTGSGTTADVFRFESIDPQTYPSYRVNVTGAGAEFLEIDKIQAVTGGGGFIPSGSIGGVSYVQAAGIGAILLLIGGLIWWDQ